MRWDTIVHDLFTTVFDARAFRSFRPAASPAAAAVMADRPAPPPRPTVPINLHSPWTPLNIRLLSSELANHPDTVFIRTLCHDMHFGARIGYHGDRSRLIAPNLRSALNNPSAVSAYLAKEFSLNHMAGPYSSPLSITFDVLELVLYLRSPVTCA